VPQIAHLGRSPSVAVFAYHAIAELPDHWGLQPFSLPPADFAAHLDALTRTGHRFIDIGTLLAGLDGSVALPKRSVLISFDDCYDDLRTVAAPLLAARGIPAVAFAVAGRFGGTNDWDTAPSDQRLRLLDADGLQEVRRLGIELGAHSLTHPALTELGESELNTEIAGCLDAFKAAGLDPPRAFAYPYGRQNAAVVTAVREAGFLAAFTTRAGLVTRDSDRYRLPRIEIHRVDTGLRFRLRLAARRAPASLRRILDVAR
jgi:peptidoglycan/xylan/chitin deacetylase (PgdA/CDA1 family)